MARRGSRPSESGRHRHSLKTGGDLSELRVYTTFRALQAPRETPSVGASPPSYRDSTVDCVHFVRAQRRPIVEPEQKAKATNITKEG